MGLVGSNEVLREFVEFNGLAVLTVLFELLVSIVSIVSIVLVVELEEEEEVDMEDEMIEGEEYEVRGRDKVEEERRVDWRELKWERA